MTAHEAPGDSNPNLGDAILALASVAHEMRGPLAAIETCTAAFELKVQGREEIARDARRFFDRLRRNTKVLARMVNDLLAAGNAQGISETLQRKPADLASIVAQAVSAAPAGATVRFVDRPTGSAVIAGDEDRIGQIVSNLIRNGIEHGTGWVDVRLFPSPAGWTLVVENGGEIAPALQNRLFEPFVRGRSGGQGLGLGLHLVRRLVEAHGGTVTCRSADGRVSFVVFLPL